MKIQMTSRRVLLAMLAIHGHFSGGNYTIVAEFSGMSFFDHFDFFNATDPSHGFVTYVKSTHAAEKRYIGHVEGEMNTSLAYMRVDHKDISPLGRPSLRIISKKSWTHGLIVADVHAVPTGCSLWPALWMVNSGPWPGVTGEIDIIEGVHNITANSMTLHTSAGCVVASASDLFSGKMETDDCNVQASSQSTNTGCSIEDTSVMTASSNYATAGLDFDLRGGGVYVTQWTSSDITIFFFPRYRIPSDIIEGRPIPSLWTEKPLARFVGSGCILDDHVSNLSLVINTNFCGDWAGSTWLSSGCAAETGIEHCDDFVADTPLAFTKTLWLIESIKVYQVTQNISN